MVVGALALAGCTPLGPSTINWGRTAYNQSVQETEAQQLLLNIVRQRYNDPVMFLDVTNISSTTTRTANFSLSAVLPNNARNTLNSGVGGVFTESPLIFYAPNTGAKFVNQILTPLDIKTLSLMLQSGWSIERVLMVAGESIDGIRNSISGKGRGGASPYADYRTLVAALRDLQRSGQLSASIEPKGASDTDLLVLTPSADSVGSESYLRACRILERGCDGGPIRIQLGIGKHAPDNPIISLATRSLYASFYFLSDGVDPTASIRRRQIWRGESCRRAGSTAAPLTDPPTISFRCILPAKSPPTPQSRSSTGTPGFISPKPMSIPKPHFPS